MASVTSLGVHTPVALPYLIAEGFLPPEPRKESYKWDTYVIEEDHGDHEEEIFTSDRVVVWSQGKFVKKVYRFDLENEIVKQAVLTQFPTSLVAQSLQNESYNSQDPGRNRHSLASTLVSSPGQIPSSTDGSLTRALVVILKTKAHLYFLQGSSHIIDLPFEIEKAFPAPCGLLLQRKRTGGIPSPPAPLLPIVPTNSFLSSRTRSSQSFLQSPTLARSLAQSQPSRPSPLGQSTTLSSLFQGTGFPHTGDTDDDITNIYSLTNPLSDLGVVTFSIQQQRPRIYGKPHSGWSVGFEDLDSAETVIYVSPHNELPSSKSPSAPSLVIVVTFNSESEAITIWHAWYLEQRSLRALLKQRAEQKAAKARRRSSFMSANLATGTSTPAVRHRDRDSIAAPGTIRLPGEPSQLQTSAVRSKKPTRQEEEQAMASQMDPDYQPAPIQPPDRERRRISSMNTDVRASHQSSHPSFPVAVSRRAASYGGPNERRSLGGHRRSRGSTPGSAYSRSMGLDDDTMDLDSTIEMDDDETVDQILRHIRATYDVAGIDSVFGCSDEGYKREVVLRKVHSFQATPLFASKGSMVIDHTAFKIVSFINSRPLGNIKNEVFSIYIHNRLSNELRCLEYQLKHCIIWPELQHSPSIAIPFLHDERSCAKCDDVLKLKDGDIRAILFGRVGLMFALDSALCQLPRAAPYRVYDPLATLSHSPSADKDVGRNRIVDPPGGSCALLHAGAHGSFDEVSSIHHRRRLQLRPQSRFIDKILETCEVVLPTTESQRVRSMWCVALAWLEAHTQNLPGTECADEMVALAATIFSFVLELFGSKARTTFNISKRSARKSTTPTQNSPPLPEESHKRRVFLSPVWSGLPNTHSLPRRRTTRQDEKRTDQFLCVAAGLAFEISNAGSTKSSSKSSDLAYRLMMALHVLREEQKLDILSSARSALHEIALIISQLGRLVRLDEWSANSGTYHALEGVDEYRWAYADIGTSNVPLLSPIDRPLGIFEWFERAVKHAVAEPFPALSSIAQPGVSIHVTESAYYQVIAKLTPRTIALSNLLEATGSLSVAPNITVEIMSKLGITNEVLTTLPESIAAPMNEAMAQCKQQPPTTWPPHLLRLVGREDLTLSADCGVGNDTPTVNIPEERPSADVARGWAASKVDDAVSLAPRDVYTVCGHIDSALIPTKTREASRHAVSQLIFNEDRRLVDVTSLMHFMSPQVAECPKQPEWDDATHLDHQRKLMFHVVTRMIALPAGDGMLHYNSQTPLLTERFILQGFSSSCVIYPMGHTLTTDRTGLTEEKLNWAYFHAGVSSGLRISRNAKGIDTSWIAFNKPNELTNRHAGLLLALGLAGHLRHLAKWLSFKYLTPKHTMTSVGLLLGLSASHLGTMDSLVTRMLSVHITRMLPPGASELNVSPATQTAGLMGIGLLYHNTQHRRMTEIMLSEIEYMEIEDPDSGPDPLRDESYRLAAGFALGLINLGKGRELRGLHGMQLPERLLAMAVGPRPVNAVHVFDRATAGAVMAIALIYMKTNDKAIATKIDVPDTEAQFDHVRPDILLLRAMTKHIILWDSIDVDEANNPIKVGESFSLFPWIHANLPSSYRTTPLTESILTMLRHRAVHSKYIPLLNVHTGLALALSFKYAGTGNTHARGEILALLGSFHQLNQGIRAHYFDGKLGQAALRRCMDVLALAAATVMAGTGDLVTLRYLRRMHGRVDAETNYGSHLAAHMAIGVLFLAGGTHTFGTGDFAIAMLMAAFYPLWPVDVLDNRVHLQAFRHLWTLASEGRCLVAEDVDTQRPVHMDIVVTMRDGSSQELRSPCLLPELDKVKEVKTKNSGYWPVTLDFEANLDHLNGFRKDQRVLIRQSHDRSDLDERLELTSATGSNKRDSLWNLRLLFGWAERQRKMDNESDDEADRDARGPKPVWLSQNVVEGLRAKVEARMENVARQS